MQVSAVVIFYNPDNSVLDNLRTYINQVERTFIIDNSDKPLNDSLISEIILNNNIEYISNHKNMGIAAALNIGLKKAISEGYNYVLTMDQDGKAAPDLISKLLEIMTTSDKIGIVAAEHMDPDLHNLPVNNITKEVLYTMTNGNLLNLSAYQSSGEYLEELFIDHVDHEFCLRLNKNGYKIIKTNNTFIYHKLGKALKKRIFNFNLYPTFHSPIRLYYRTRNRFYVNNLYKKIFPGYVKEDRKHMLREIFDIILCEKDLYNKFKMILRGYRDYRKKRLGEFKGESR